MMLEMFICSVFTVHMLSLQDCDEMKMKQKQGVVNIVAKKKEYFIKVSQ